MISQTISHYRVVRKLGAGGMGEVYLAEDTKLGRRLALKMLPEQFTRDSGRLRRFEQEARAASALNHPNIVTIYEIGEAEARRFIAMEFVQGRTLREMVGERLSPDSLATVGAQIAEALAAAHAAGIVHRDIKPENIMLRDDGYVKVLDFGLARLGSTVLHSEAPTDTQTAPGTVLGTMGYMSPEQARGEAVTSASDIFSLGLLLYELATGKHPFATGSPLGTVQAILSQVALSPSLLNPELPPTHAALILQVLEKDARLRPSAAVVHTTLAEMSEKRVGSVAAPSMKLRKERHVVGREKERAELRVGFAGATAGRSLLLCIAGEPGIGKTTVVEEFLHELTASDQPCTIARGRCSERLAGTEAYLPWLEALEGLLHDRTDESFARLMRTLAPSWYTRVAPLAANDSSDERALRESAAGSQERVKRELRAFFQEISRLRPLVLFVDDLQWADVSTTDLLGYLASNAEAMRLLIVVTYRPSDLLLTKHPFLQLKPDLQARGICRESSLGFLSRQEIEQYLALEFPKHRLPPQFPALLHTKTEGSPLFVADLVRYLRDRQVIQDQQGGWALTESMPAIERDLPQSVRGMIERKIAQLSEKDRRLLVAASVQGYEFDSAVVAKVLAAEPAVVEEQLEVMERVYAFVRMVDEREFPDRTLSLRYRFVHVLYQNALYGLLQPTRKAQLSAAVAYGLEGYWAEKNAAVANELAVLFEAARDFARAVRYYLLAAQQAAAVFANQEAVILAQRGLGLLRSSPVTPERNRLELTLRLSMGAPLSAIEGYSALHVKENYDRAYELCQQLGASPQLFPVLAGLWGFNLVRAELQTARELAEQLLRLAEREGKPVLQVEAHRAMGHTLSHIGETLAAQPHLDQAITLYDRQHSASHVLLHGLDPGVTCRCFKSWNLWLLGHPDQAVEWMNQALALARKLAHLQSLVFALSFAGWLYQFRREPRVTLELAEELVAFCREQGFPEFLAYGNLLRGWAATAEQGRGAEGIGEMLQGLSAYRSTGSLSASHMLAMLAEGYDRLGQTDEALAALAEAQTVADRTGNRYYDAELHRFRGELLLKSVQDNQPLEAEACFRHAVEAARRQNAKAWELRAATSLSRLWQKQGKRDEASQMLREIYGWFTEGFDTVDLREAHALLGELA